MLRSPLVAFLLLFSGESIAVAESPADTPEQKVLERWLGKWRVNYTLQKTEWNPEARKETAEASAERILGGKFIQEKSEHSDKTSNTRILTYDAQKNTYRGWWFSSKGYSSEDVGEWDAASNTMTWTGHQDGNTRTTITHFADENTLEWSVEIKDRTEKTLFRMDGKSERVVDAKKEKTGSGMEP